MEDWEICKQWLSNVAHSMEGMWMETWYRRAWCPSATGCHRLEGHSWVTDIGSGDPIPAFAKFLSFAEIFPSLDKEESLVRTEAESSSLPWTPMSLVPQGCSAACCPMLKSVWEVTAQQWPKQDKVGTFLLGCGALRLIVTSEFLPQQL